MKLFETIGTYADTLVVAFTLISAFIGWLTAKAKQKRQIEVVFRSETGGAAAGTGAGAELAPVRLEPSGWRILSTFPRLLVHVFPLLVFITLLFAFLGWVDEDSPSSGALTGILYSAGIYGVFLLLLLPIESIALLYAKLSRLSWTVEGRGLTIRRWGRDESFHWAEVDSVKVGPGWMDVTIGAPGAHISRSIRCLSPAFQSRAVALARAARVRIVPWNPKKMKGAE